MFLTSSAARYDFEYEDDGEEDSADVDIENKYYNAKQIKDSDPDKAIEEFLEIPALESEKGEWGFKGLKQAIKLEYRLGKYDKVNPQCSPTVAASSLTMAIRPWSTTLSFSPTLNPR
ncbi:hypothetical protein RRF57_011446 [Xylaria bambusicola]|uniref:Uncharacterized protein n=1 Tax=Xylaria bambusicola TaxID=326684 RepID=A0AAN7V4L8_9PEZI